MKKIKFLKLGKVKIANVNDTNKVFGGGQTDFCDTDSCKKDQCLEPTQTGPTSNNEDVCTGSILNCITRDDQTC
ncbi:hypothetical protein [uncultured Kordia sp.]|uniref:hypothetical protein n=1 Tax=uncultured Kordia sp. TaxID=507699 RepID=UPI002637B031|nr:hypothetical protein [uncultured Kordia sp.]